jgi:Dolichyl-phosphate-mannose-protein mannosyltransferase
MLKRDSNQIREALGPAALTLLFLLLAWAVNPYGNFPLSDDWCYGPAVFQLVRTGHVNPVRIWLPTVLGQIYLAYPFCLMLGQNYQALRVFGMVMALLGIWGSYALSRLVGAPRSLAFLAGLAVLCNPMFFELSLTFMTDVPFFAVTVWSFWLSWRLLHRRSFIDTAVLTLASILAVMIRQFGIVLPTAFAIAQMLRYKRLNKDVLLSALPLACASFCLALLSYIRQQIFSHSDYQFDTIMVALTSLQTFAPLLLEKVPLWLMYVGLFALPLVVVSFASLNIRKRLIIAVLSLELTLLLVYSGGAIGSGPIVLYTFGIGPCMFQNPELALPHLPQAIWALVTFAAVLSGFCILWVIGSECRKLFVQKSDAGESASILFILLSILFFSLAVSTTMATYDRYYLPILVPILMLICWRVRHADLRRANYIWAILVCVVFAYFAVTATHDYFAWNRAQWQLTFRVMQERRLQPGSIALDKGPLADRFYGSPESLTDLHWRNEQAPVQVVLSFDKSGTGTMIDSVRFKRWLVPGEGTIYAWMR